MVIPQEMKEMSEKAFQAYMIGWIKEHYSSYLGADSRLLDLPNGLDLVKMRVEADLDHGRAKAA